MLCTRNFRAEEYFNKIYPMNFLKQKSNNFYKTRAHRRDIRA